MASCHNSRIRVVCLHYRPQTTLPSDFDANGPFEPPKVDPLTVWGVLFWAAARTIPRTVSSNRLFLEITLSIYERATTPLSVTKQKD